MSPAKGFILTYGEPKTIRERTPPRWRCEYDSQGGMAAILGLMGRGCERGNAMIENMCTVCLFHNLAFSKHRCRDWEGL
jgi:hypothetical protein